MDFKSIRGNLNTRLGKLDGAADEQYDALILAKAGTDRMHWQDRVDEVLTGDTCLYAVGQVRATLRF
jgi:hydroxymethylbilane synthase